MKIISITLKFFFTAMFLIKSAAIFAAVNLTGVGATFPLPIYTTWAHAYQKETTNKVNYQGIGSSGGVKQIIANTVDFGASDVPLTEDKLAAEGLFQFPAVMGGVVLAVNIPGVNSGDLILDGKTLGDIYLGKIKKWNDSAITRLNPHLTLPSQNIAVIRRADGSGTSFIFTSYLAKVNSQWQEKIGIGSTVNWPLGLGGKGNEGVAAFIQRLSGSIGYVEYAYAKQNKLSYTRLVSADNEIVSPTIETFSAAAKSIDWSQSFAHDLTNRSGKNVWPLTSTTFILLHKKQKNLEKGVALLEFFAWAYEKGTQAAQDLDYVPLPPEVVTQIKTAWQKQIKDSQGNALY